MCFHHISKNLQVWFLEIVTCQNNQKFTEKPTGIGFDNLDEKLNLELDKVMYHNS